MRRRQSAYGIGETQLHRESIGALRKGVSWTSHAHLSAFLRPSLPPDTGTMSETDIVAGGLAEGPTRGKITAVGNEFSVDSPWLEDQERDTARHARLILSTAAALTAHAPVAQRIERRFPVP